MHAKAALVLAFVPDGTQTFGLWVMRVVQKTGVLDRKYLPVLCDPLNRSLVMWCSDALRCHLVVVEKPIGSFGVCPIFTRLVDRPAWLHRKLLSQLAASPIQTRVLQLSSGKLIKAPLAF
jgi:hypothetical protein